MKSYNFLHIGILNKMSNTLSFFHQEFQSSDVMAIK